MTPEDIRNTKSVKIEGLVWIPEDSSGFSFYASGSNGAIYHIQFEDEQWVATVDCFPLDTTGDAYTCRAACERHNKEFS